MKVEMDESMINECMSSRWAFFSLTLHSFFQPSFSKLVNSMSRMYDFKNNSQVESASRCLKQ